MSSQDIEWRGIPLGNQVRRITPSLSAALDSARALAACYVVLHHVANAHELSTGLGLIFRFGQEAVLVFFLLSGFVIYANERNRVQKPFGYYMRRLRRIYPPLIAAVALSTTIAIMNGNLAETFSIKELIGTLFSLQDLGALKPGVIVEPYMRNDPLWSLSYEVLFYAVFPLVFRIWSRNKIWGDHGIGLICCASYIAYIICPNHFTLVAAYFLVWWVGAMAAEAYLGGARDIRAIARPYAWLLTLSGLALIGVVIVGYKKFGVYPSLQLRHFATGAAMLAILGGPIGRIISSHAARFEKPAKFVASISYGIYVLHVPLLIQWRFAWNPVGFAVALALLVALSFWVEKLLPKMLPKAPIT